MGARVRAVAEAYKQIESDSDEDTGDVPVYTGESDYITIAEGDNPLSIVMKKYTGGGTGDGGDFVLAGDCEWTGLGSTLWRGLLTILEGISMRWKN